ncbi:DUF3304 domain-containing protein [Pseudomonas protegens]|uniref:DUF3304 domain-containing protein n=1 Tax=Pseudomonas protegens TaxID=380021 RepID=UPI00276401D5|nr:DUF3304 domain-containing protein [Pseudomonas protegens]MDP9530439.1 DUF3304 domain-containing protein [Pseudomonas protegens]
MEKFFASGLFGVLSVARGCLLVAGLLIASACQSESKMLSAPVTGYNHTSAAINRFSVNGAGGGNVGPHQGGGSQVCCGVVPRHWVLGLRAIVEWEKDPDPYAYGKWPERPYSDAWNKRMAEHKKSYSRHKAIVEIPRYSVAGTLKVHFLPCNQVRVSADNIKVMDPRYPYSYPMKMEEPEVC